MKKNTRPTSLPPVFIAFALFVVICLVGFKFYQYSLLPVSSPQDVQPIPSFDFGNHAFMVNGQSIKFINGIYSVSDPVTGDHSASITNVTQSAAPTSTRAAAVLVDNPGGSGTFYYVVGAMLKDGQEIYSTPILLSDRIQVTSITVENPALQDNGLITVNYLARPANAPMAAAPTKPAIAKYAFQENGDLIQVLH